MIYLKEHEFESYRPKFEPQSGLPLTVWPWASYPLRVSLLIHINEGINNIYLKKLIWQLDENCWHRRHSQLDSLIPPPETASPSSKVLTWIKGLPSHVLLWGVSRNPHLILTRKKAGSIVIPTLLMRKVKQTSGLDCPGPGGRDGAP